MTNGAISHMLWLQQCIDEDDQSHYPCMASPGSSICSISSALRLLTTSIVYEQHRRGRSALSRTLLA